MSFRSTLKRELSLWLDEGLVDGRQAEAIYGRYALDDLQTGPAGLLLPAIYLCGAFLIGGGTISFVAAHWDAIPVPLRIGLLISTMLACEISGFALWKVRGTRERLGQALVTLGALVFGASIFLIAQMYHLHGSPHNAFGVWALGALALAYATASSPTMFLACATSLVWAVGWTEAHPHALCWYPMAICAASIPFLIRRCVLTFTGLLLAVGIVTCVCAGEDSGQEWAVFLAMTGTGALYYGLGVWLGRRESSSLLAVPARLLGAAAVLLSAFMLSFGDGPGVDALRHLWQSEGWLWTALLGLVCAGAALAWTAALRAPRGGDDTGVKSASVLLAALLLALGIALGQELVLQIVANLALLAMGGGLIWNAVALGRRREFWKGLLLLVLVVVVRFLEWDTHLMLKSAVFILCGVGVILGGVRFERYLKGREGADD